MNIKQLSFNQIDVIVGASKENVTDAPINNNSNECLTGRTVIDECLPVTYRTEYRDKYFNRRCMPKAKPEKCSYEAWGMLHALLEETGTTIGKC
jgi:hypothetical protein